MNATLPIARDEARITPAIEDYLKAIYQLNQEEPEVGSVTGQRIAERLGVASPSVTNMIKRLSDLGLVQHERYRGVELSDAGERIALEVVRHHRLLERYLVEALGYGWDEVHDDSPGVWLSPADVSPFHVALVGTHVDVEDPESDLDEALLFLMDQERETVWPAVDPARLCQLRRGTVR